MEEVHTVYRSQGVDIHDKHIEVIVHQMTRRVTIIDSGDTDLLPGELVDNARFREINRNIVKNGGRPAVGRPALMGITKRRWPPTPAVRRILPGDHPRAHRSRPLREGRRPQGPQGERHHR